MACLSAPCVLRSRRRRRNLRGCLLAAAAVCLSWTHDVRPQAAFDLTFHIGGHTFSIRPKPKKVEPSLGTKVCDWVAQHTGLLALLTAALCTYDIVTEEPLPDDESCEVVPSPERQCRDNMVSVTLCGLSGMVNAVAIIEMAGTVAHQTGNASQLGRLLGVDAARFGAPVLAFALGAGVAGFSNADREALFKSQYCPCMMGSAFSTAVGVALQWASGGSSWAVLPLWAFAQGLQNGTTSKFPGTPLRSTHHTGTLTDAGADIGLLLRALRKGEPLPDMQRAAQLLTRVVSFACGGLAAKLGTDRWGIWAAMPAAVAMAALATGWFPIAVPAPKSA